MIGGEGQSEKFLQGQMEKRGGILLFLRRDRCLRDTTKKKEKSSYPRGKKGGGKTGIAEALGLEGRRFLFVLNGRPALLKDKGKGGRTYCRMRQRREGR